MVDIPPHNLFTAYKEEMYGWCEVVNRKRKKDKKDKEGTAVHCTVSSRLISRKWRLQKNHCESTPVYGFPYYNIRPKLKIVFGNDLYDILKPRQIPIEVCDIIHSFYIGLCFIDLVNQKEITSLSEVVVKQRRIGGASIYPEIILVEKSYLFMIHRTGEKAEKGTFNLNYSYILDCMIWYFMPELTIDIPAHIRSVYKRNHVGAKNVIDYDIYYNTTLIHPVLATYIVRIFRGLDESLEECFKLILLIYNDETGANRPNWFYSDKWYDEDGNHLTIDNYRFYVKFFKDFDFCLNLVKKLVKSSECCPKKLKTYLDSIIDSPQHLQYDLEDNHIEIVEFFDFSEKELYYLKYFITMI